MLICQPLLPASALSDSQKSAIAAGCTSIKDTLKKLQKDDSRARVYLGGYYETIISKFITPLNVRLVENSLSSAELIENQNNLASIKTGFVSDFVDYQRNLETLVSLDCSSDPEAFYQKLSEVRQKRANVSSEVQKMRSLVSNHLQLAESVKAKLP